MVREYDSLAGQQWRARCRPIAGVHHEPTTTTTIHGHILRDHSGCPATTTAARTVPESRYTYAKPEQRIKYIPIVLRNRHRDSSLCLVDDAPLSPLSFQLELHNRARRAPKEKVPRYATYFLSFYVTFLRAASFIYT